LVAADKVPVPGLDAENVDVRRLLFIVGEVSLHDELAAEFFFRVAGPAGPPASAQKSERAERTDDSETCECSPTGYANTLRRAAQETAT